MEKEKRIPLGKLICGIGGVIVCLLFSFVLQVPASIEAAAASVGSTGTIAMRILGVTLLAVFWWIGNVGTDWMVTLVMLMLWVVMAEIPFSKAFAAYADSSTWIIVGAFCLAEAVSKTGLFTRISWFLLRIFPPTFNGQVLAMLLVGAICTPLIPSMTAKAILGVTVASGVATAMGYPNHSHGRYALFMAAWFGFGVTAPAFVNGSIFGYTLLGALPEGVTCTYVEWFLAMIPWLTIILIGGFVIIKLLYRPEQSGALTKEYAAEHYKRLGKLQGKELQSALILAGAVILWVLESVLGIPAAVTALGAGLLCFALGILDVKEIATAPKWSIVIFLGGVLALGSVFSGAGIDIWLQTWIAPLFEKINNTYLAALVIMVMVVVLRLILASFSATIIIMMAVLTPVASTIGLSPFIIGILVYTVENSWFVRYQNTTYTTCFECVKDTIEYRGTVKASFAYIVLCIIACLVSIPYWSALNYI